MVQTKKFENTFINEYLAINLHERDLQKRATERGLQKGLQQGLQKGLQQGKLDAYADLIKSGFISMKDAASKLGISEDELRSLVDRK